MKVEIISPGIIHITTTELYELSSTFIRMQEFYESSAGLQGKYFTMEHCMDVCADSHEDKEFTYLSDWGGFNVPGHVVDKFFEVFKGKLLDKEKRLQTLLRAKMKEVSSTQDGKYYIIGTYTCLDSSTYIYHECCHALWYMYPEFQAQSLSIMHKLPKPFIKALTNSLTSYGYDVSVMDDEINAYLSTSDMCYIKTVLLEQYSPRTFPWDTVSDLQQNFYEFFNTVDTENLPDE